MSHPHLDCPTCNELRYGGIKVMLAAKKKFEESLKRLDEVKIGE